MHTQITKEHQWVSGSRRFIIQTSEPDHSGPAVVLNQCRSHPNVILMLS